MNNVSIATQRLLTYALLPGIGSQTLRVLADIPHLVERSPQELTRRLPLLSRALHTTQAWDKAEAAALHQLRESERTDTRIVSRLDPDYPVLLAQSSDDPVVLWVRGTLPSSTQPTVAVIGAREATLHGLEIANRVTRHLVEKGFSIVSGLAVGVDTAAHAAALDVGGHTIAVLAHGLQTVSPSENRILADRILASGGALLSEYPLGRAPRSHQFVQRDKTQAGLAQGVIMIQTSLQGGSLHATRAALSYGRWVAVPYPTDFDRTSKAPKIEANLVIADGTTAEKMDLLHCNEAALAHIRVLRTREDYSHLQPQEQTTAAHPVPSEPLQQSFF